MKISNILISVLVTILMIGTASQLKTFAEAQDTNGPLTSPITSPISSPVIIVTAPPSAPQNGGSNSNNNGNSNSGNNNSNSSNNNSSNNSCSATRPTSAPVLFQINTSKNSVTLYFTPARDADTYNVFYGKKLGQHEYGAVLNDSNKLGVKKLTINHLAPNTTYYFTVSAKNGCASGDSSNWLGAKTNGGVFYLFGKTQGSILGVKTNVKTIKKVVPTPKTTNKKISKK